MLEKIFKKISDKCNEYEQEEKYPVELIPRYNLIDVTVCVQRLLILARQVPTNQALSLEQIRARIGLNALELYGGNDITFDVLDWMVLMNIWQMDQSGWYYIANR